MNENFLTHRILSLPTGEKFDRRSVLQDFVYDLKDRNPFKAGSQNLRLDGVYSEKNWKVDCIIDVLYTFGDKLKYLLAGCSTRYLKSGDNNCREFNSILARVDNCLTNLAGYNVAIRFQSELETIYVTRKANGDIKDIYNRNDVFGLKNVNGITRFFAVPTIGNITEVNMSERRRYIYGDMHPDNSTILPNFLSYSNISLEDFLLSKKYVILINDHYQLANPLSLWSKENIGKELFDIRIRRTFAKMLDAAIVSNWKIDSVYTSTGCSTLEEHFKEVKDW